MRRAPRVDANHRAIVKALRLVLPWPPTANNSKIPVQVRSRKTHKIVSRNVSTSDLKSYKKAAAMIARLSRARVPGFVHVVIHVFEPNGYRRDIANLEKAPIDAIVDAGVIDDDCKIDHLEIRRHRGQLVPGGRLVVEIEEIKEAPL